jgi:hypothetical protein
MKKFYQENFTYPHAFLKKKYPKISGILYVGPQGYDELTVLDKLKLFETVTRPSYDLKVPRSLFLVFYLTPFEIGIQSYNLQEDMIQRLKTRFS